MRGGGGRKVACQVWYGIGVGLKKDGGMNVRYCLVWWREEGNPPDIS